MNQAHLHLVLNHFPIIGLIIGTLVLLAGNLLKVPTAKKVALIILIGAAVFAVPTFLTGEGAEDIVEKVGGISESYIEKHEELAEIFIWLIVATGILSLISIISSFSKPRLFDGLSMLTLVMGLVSIFYAQQVGTSGGEIRHSEIRESSNETTNQDSNREEKLEKEDD
jgi:uncharacterized membrane protein